MLKYYTVTDIIAGLTLFIIAFLIHENSRFDAYTKKKFYKTYTVILAAMIAEWASVMLNEAPGWTVGLHKVVKCMDYILTPATGVFIVNQVSERGRIQKSLEVIVGANFLLQIISIVTGWTFYIDSENIYHHGPLYNLYIITYLLVIAGVLAEFYLYGKKYKKQNRMSLFAIILLVIVGITVQQICGYRVSYLALTICAILLFIHYSEFSQLASDENILYHKKLLETDTLTGLYNRYAFTNDLKQLEADQRLPEKLVVFSVDINELKTVNDSQGHLAGDEIIKGAADCIREALQTYGKCYRTGGDEFIALLYIEESRAYELKTHLEKYADEWQGHLVEQLSLSIGYAAAKKYPEAQAEMLIHVADENMYEAKAQYYMQSGKNRRKNESKRRESIDVKRQEYMDIITALSSDVNGLYIIDRRKREVTTYRLSASDHRIRSGVPLKQGFEAAMHQFIERKVHPDDRSLMRQSIQLDFIESELSEKTIFRFHFRTLINGEIHFHYMKCIKNIENDEYDKIIVAFCPEDSLVSRKKIQETIKIGGNAKIRTILVAEADPDNRQSLKEYLQQDYHIILAESGEHALDILKRQYRELAAVLFDRNMPGMNGLQFLKKIKDNPFFSSVPVILMADDGGEELDKRCIESGAVEFFIKPYNAVILKNRIQNVIQMNAMAESLDEIEIDDLTGLYTRPAFLHHAKILIDESPEESFTIILSDIQNFRIHNSIYGENRSDELLKILADYIRKTVVNGISARFGADQFVTIVKSKKDSTIIDAIKQMQLFVNRSIAEHVVLKFGIYENVDKSLDIALMCDMAMLALKSIKHNYDHSYALFDGPVSQKQYRAQMFESRFKAAIEQHEFVVWYQPKYDSYTEKVVGAEALVRWQSEEQLISPSEFLPVFESNGLICQLDEYVFRTVCEHQRKWKEKGMELIPISVNLSRNSMHQPDIVKRYKAIVEEVGISPAMVPIEITESAAIGTIEIKPLADAFYEAGFSLHMDDFGSGNSSLTGLNILHFDVVKLDKSLIDYIGDEHGNLVLMYTIALGKELGLHLVAEGVENEVQFNYLKDNGCEAVQGYYFCRPLPEYEFEQKVENNLEANTEVYDYKYKLTASDSVVKRAMDRLLHRMPGGFFTYRHNEDERIILSNRYLWNLFGCETEDEFMKHVGGSFKGIVCPEDLERVERYIREQIDHNANDMDYVEYHIIRKDGKKIPVVDYGHLDRRPDGDIFYVFISEAGS